MIDGWRKWIQQNGKQHLRSIPRWTLVILLSVTVLGGVLWWSAWQTRKNSDVEHREAASPASAVDTSNWKLFRHPEYAYEVKYPEESEIKLLDDQREASSELEIRIGDGKSTGYVYLRRESEANGSRDALSYAQDERDGVLQPGVAPLLVDISDVKKYSINSWSAFGYEVTEAIAGTVTKRTYLFVSHEGHVYRIIFTEENPVEAAIVSSVRFL